MAAGCVLQAGSSQQEAPPPEECGLVVKLAVLLAVDSFSSSTVLLLPPHFFPFPFVSVYLFISLALLLSLPFSLSSFLSLALSLSFSLPVEKSVDAVRECWLIASPAWNVRNAHRTSRYRPPPALKPLLFTSAPVKQPPQHTHTHTHTAFLNPRQTASAPSLSLFLIRLLIR